MSGNRYFVEKEIIMGATQIRELLHDYINKADERFINLMYAMVQADMKEDYTLPGKPMSKATLKKRVRAAKSRIKAGQFTTQEDLENEMKEW